MYHCDLCGAEKPEDCICTEHQKEAYSRQASSFHDAIGGWRKENIQSETRIRELEEAIRKFLEADMEMDDKLSYGKDIPTKLSQTVKDARRGLLKARSEKSVRLDKEDGDE